MSLPISLLLPMLVLPAAAAAAAAALLLRARRRLAAAEAALADSEAALAGSEARWRGIFEHLHEGFMLGEVVYDADGKAIDATHLAVNAAWEAMTGIARERAIGRPALELLPALEREWIDDFAQVSESGVPRTVVRRVAGADRWLEANIFGTEPGQFGVLFVDASTRVAAQQRVLDSEARLRFVMDAMPQKIFTATPDGAVDYFNPQWTAFTGLSFDQILAWGWTQFVHPEDVEGNVAAWKRSIQTGEPFEFEHRFRRLDGQYRWHLSRAVPQRDDAGHIAKWVGSNSDVHDQMEASAALRVSSAALLESDRRKTEFLAMLAHELRNPLAPLSYALDMLTGERGARADIGQVAAVMRRQVTQLARLVDELLDVNRISRGKVELRTEAVELGVLLRHAAETARPALEDSGHVLVLEHPPEPVRFQGDPVRLGQVLSNLLGNAVKYTPAGGRIVVAGGRDADQAWVRVTDSGIGIPAESIEVIFELFVQLDRRQERQHAGLGVGLNLVRRLVELHGGTVSAASAGPGLGSEFEVRLPLVPPQPTADGARAGLPLSQADPAARA